MGMIPREMAKANKLVPVARLNGKLFIAMVDPTNVLAVDDVKRRVQLDVVPMIATEKSVADALSGVHGGRTMGQVLRKVAEEAEKPDGVEVQAKASEEIDIDRLATDSEDAPVIKIVNLIMVQAIRENASDIHIEPFQKS
jgi:type IV pilus assembly protein PilB